MTDLKNLNATYVPTTTYTGIDAEDVDDGGAAEATQGTAAAGADTAAGSVDEATVMAAMQSIAQAGYFGVQAYGAAQGTSDGATAAIGRVVVPASAQQASNTTDLQGGLSTLSTFDTGGLLGADGPVGTASWLGAERGQAVDVDGLSGASTASGTSGYGSSAVALTMGTVGSDGDATTDATNTANTSSVKTNATTSTTASTTTSASSTDAATVDGTNVVSSLSPTDSTLSTDDLAKKFDDESKNYDKSCKKQKLNDGEQNNAKTLLNDLSKYGLTEDQANTIAMTMNSASKYGTTGDVRNNIVNLAVTAIKLSEMGSGSKDAAKEAVAQLQDIAKEAKNGSDGTLSTDFVTATNVGQSYYLQYALSLKNDTTLTDLTTPTTSTGVADTMTYEEYVKAMGG